MQTAIIAAVLTAGAVTGLVSLGFSLFEERWAFRRQVEALKAPGAENARRADLTPEEMIARRIKEARAAQRRGQRTLAAKLKNAGISTSPMKFQMLALAASSVAGAALFIATGSALMAVGSMLACAYLGPLLYLNKRIEARKADFESAFPNAIELMVSGLLTGRSVTDCIQSVATDGPEAVRAEFKVVKDALELSLPLKDAVERLADRVDSEAVRFFALVTSVQAETGGQLVPPLRGLVVNLRDRLQTDRLVARYRAGPLRQALLIALISIALAVFLITTNENVRQTMLETTAGLVSLGGGAAWMIAGTFLMRRISKIAT